MKNKESVLIFCSDKFKELNDTWYYSLKNEGYEVESTEDNANVYDRYDYYLFLNVFGHMNEDMLANLDYIEHEVQGQIFFLEGNWKRNQRTCSNEKILYKFDISGFSPINTERFDDAYLLLNDNYDEIKKLRNIRFELEERNQTENHYNEIKLFPTRQDHVHDAVENKMITEKEQIESLKELKNKFYKQPKQYSEQKPVRTKTLAEATFDAIQKEGTKVSKQEIESLNSLSQRVHNLAKQKEWHLPISYDKNDIIKNKHEKLVTCLMLVVSEISEAVEELRNGGRCDYVNSETMKPEGFDVELADALIRILDICAWLKIDIGDVLAKKHEYNRTRPKKHGGKKF